MIPDSFSRRRALKTVGAGLATLAGVGSAAGQEPDAHRYVVGTTSGASQRAISTDATAIHRTIEFGSIGVATVGTFTAEEAAACEARRDVRYVERDHVRTAVETVAAGTRSGTDLAADPSEEQIVPWGVDRVEVTEVPEKSESRRAASIAVLDTGIDPAHESLEVAEGRAFVDCSPGCEDEWDDDGGHGTHIAGTAAAADNGIGVVGTKPNAELCAVKVLRGDGSGHDSDIAAAIEWCADEGIDVITLSLGGPEPATVLEDALAYAYENGVLVVAAAGNAGPNEGTVDYPADYDECIAVGATDSRDAVADFSARGDGIELVAPGVDIVSTAPGDDYETLSGTSMAVPHVAGIAARLIGAGVPHADRLDDYENPGGVREILRDTAEDVGAEDVEQGYGLVNAAAAYEEITPVAVETVDAIRARSATVAGRLRSLDDADEAAVSCQWRRAEGDDWDGTEPETRAAGEEFTETIDDLDPDTEYEVRAVAESADATEIGEGVTFATGLDELRVETVDAVAVDHETIACAGDLAGVGDAEEVAVFFEWREAGDSSWAETDAAERDGIGEFEGEVTGLDFDTEYEVRAVVAADGETDAGDAASVTTDPEPGLPEIEGFEVEDGSSQNFVSASVRWTVTDQDGELAELTSELRYADDPELLHSVTAELEGGEESGTHTLRNTDRLEGAGEEYEITLRVADHLGNVTEATETATLDERSPPPTVDRFEITPTDFFGKPTAEVEWAVSDEGEELWGVDLELCFADDDEVLDDASSMARGDEKSGSTSLRHDDEEDAGEAFDVTITVTDYFEQATTETKRVTLGD